MEAKNWRPPASSGWSERHSKNQKRAYFIRFSGNQPGKFGESQGIENSAGLWFPRSQEPVIKFSTMWRVERNLRSRWHRGR